MLKSLGFKGPGLKLGVKKSGVEMSLNHLFKDSYRKLSLTYYTAGLIHNDIVPNY